MTEGPSPSDSGAVSGADDDESEEEGLFCLLMAFLSSSCFFFCFFFFLSRFACAMRDPSTFFWDLRSRSSKPIPCFFDFLALREPLPPGEAEACAGGGMESNLNGAAGTAGCKAARACSTSARRVVVARLSVCNSACNRSEACCARCVSARAATDSRREAAKSTVSVSMVVSR